MDNSSVAGLSEALASLGSPAVQPPDRSGASRTAATTSDTVNKGSESSSVGFVTTTGGHPESTTVTSYANGSTQTAIRDPQGQVISLTTTPPDPTNTSSGTGAAPQPVHASA